MMQNLQSGKIQQQSQQLGLQQQQMNLADQQAIRKAFAGDTQGNNEQILPLATKYGVSGDGLLMLQKNLLATQSAKLAMDKATRENGDAINDRIAGAADNLLRDPQNLQQNLPRAIQGLLQDPTIPPQTKQQLSQIDLPHLIQMGNGDPIQGLKFYKGTLLSSSAMSKQAEQQSTVAKNNADAQKAGADAKRVMTQDAISQLYPVNDQPGWDAWKASLPPDLQSKIPSKLSGAAKAYVQKMGMTPDQQVSTDQAAANAAKTKRAHLSEESTARLNASVNAGRLQQERVVNGMKYGPGTQEYWVDQIAHNPDSIKEMPAELRSVVGQKFKQATGLPLPTPLTGPTKQSETAARNALDSTQFVRKAMQNPEIAANIGPIMGRLGNMEQSTGVATGLSPAAAAAAQELRTRMRYLVLQEGKAVLGGRMPQQLMEQLEQSSPNVKMDHGLLTGALNGVEENARVVMDNADKQRFGGQMRSRQMRGIGGPPLPNGGGGAIDAATAQKFYDAAGGDPAKARQLAARAGWKVQ